MRFIIILIVFLSPIIAIGQQSDVRLAQQYFVNGEFEKAASSYEKLYKKHATNNYFFARYLDCLTALERYEDAEKILKKRIRKSPKNSELYVNYGGVFEQQYKEKEADEQYQKAIKTLTPERYKITKLANAFIGKTKYDLAIATYEHGSKLLKSNHIFSYEMADLYRRKGDTQKMLSFYLNSLETTPERLASVKTLFQRYLSDDDYLELQTQLYTRIQDQPESNLYPDLLSWVFIQKKDYPNALRQEKALDKRLNENGGRVYKIAKIAYRDKDYDAAIDAYNYIVTEKGANSTYYLESKREILRCKRQKLTKGFTYTETDLRVLEKEYETFLDEFGRDKKTAKIVHELANLEAFYINDLIKATKILEELIVYPGIDSKVQARAKLNLGDFYLMQGEIWEASLLYSQVDKAFKEDVLGQDARFRNAKLSYYNADFEWAQAQFEVLKASTSKLIANDALDLSVFIMDNLALDTSATAMTQYSKADLLIFQNKFDEAFQELDDITKAFPNHGLQDDIYYAKSKVFVKKRDFVAAADILQKIVNDFDESIRQDDALFELGKLYENQLDDKAKAQEYYQTILLDHSGSTYAVEARKRFRALRGDNLEQ